jgi:hypothetical protein
MQASETVFITITSYMCWPQVTIFTGDNTKDKKFKDDTTTEVIIPIQDIKWYISWFGFVISMIFFIL